MSSVIWCGPVSAAQVSAMTVPGAALYVAPCTYDGSLGLPVCRALAGSWDRGGSYLSGMAAALGARTAPFYFGGFSAGGTVIKVVLRSPLDRQRVRAVMLADGVYQDIADNAGTIDYAVEAIAAGDRMLVATSSTGANANVRLREMKAEIERRVGRAFEELAPTAWRGVVDNLPVQLWRMGSVWLADYKGTVGHVGHLTLLQPGLWKNLLQPWDAAAPPLGSGEPPADVLTLPPAALPAESRQSLPVLGRVAAVAAAAVVGYGIARLAS